MYSHAYFPAAQAIRAVSRASIVYMLGISVAVAAALTWLAKNEKLKWAAVPLGALLVVEQGYNTPAFSKEKNRHDSQDDAGQQPSTHTTTFDLSGVVSWDGGRGARGRMPTPRHRRR